MLVTAFVKPFFTIFGSPIYYIWFEFSFWSQLIIFLIFGWTPVQEVNEETNTLEEDYVIEASFPDGEIVEGQGFDGNYDDF